MSCPVNSNELDSSSVPLPSCLIHDKTSLIPNEYTIRKQPKGPHTDRRKPPIRLDGEGSVLVITIPYLMADIPRCDGLS